MHRRHSLALPMIRWTAFLYAMVTMHAAAVEAQPYTVTFVIDLRPAVAAGRFDPATASIGIRGAHPPLSWGVSILAEDADLDTVYRATVVFPTRPFGNQPVSYKFKMEGKGNPNDGWETGRNRTFSLSTVQMTLARAFGEETPAPPPSLTGVIRRHEAFPSTFVTPRDVFVYLPPGYEKDAAKRYPVLYMQDGQNVFDGTSAGAEWQMDETAERLIRAGELPPVIIVGIANTPQRMAEYTPPGNASTETTGDIYARFLIQELKPFIDRTYHTRPEAASTGIGGSSLGGLIALYIGLNHPEVTGHILALSPSAWWNDEQIIAMVRALDRKPTVRLYTDIGTGEGTRMLDVTRRLYDALHEKGWTDGVDLLYVEDPDALHTDAAWAARVEPALRFMLKSLP